MAEEGNIVTDTVAPNGEDNMPQVGLISQYVKDLSVENPNAPQCFGWEGSPNVDVQVNIQVQTVSEEVHEVAMKLILKAEHDNGVQFNIELDYGTIFGMRNVTDDQAHPFLFGEAPRLMFPFARRVIADAVRDAGFPPFLLEPIDFNALYAQQREQADNMVMTPPAGEA